MRIAVIGTGGWGYQHARVFSQHPKAELCAIVGRNPEKAEARARQFHTKAYTNIDAMLAAERPDFVSLCLPNQGHFEPTMKVILAGYPLLVEKPLVFELDEAERLLEAAGERFFGICFNHRWAKPVQMGRSAIESGKVGDIVFASWRFGGEGSSDHPYANLIETQCHGFDMLEYLCGPIEALSAEMTQHPSTMAISLKFRSGAVGSLLGSYDTSYAYPETQRIEVSGAKGRFVIDDTVARYRFNSTGNEIGEIWEAGYFNDYDREFHRTFDSYIDAVIEAFLARSEPPVHARAGQRALQLAHAAIKSHENGTRVKV